MKTHILPLFHARLREAWSFQWRAIRTAVDWVIALYFIVPAVVLFAVQYSSWWSAVPNWIGGVPAAAAALLLYVVAAAGGIRLFVRQADILFLTQHAELFNGMRRLGLLYSFIAIGVRVILFLLATLPLSLHAFRLSPAFVLYWGLSAFLAGILQAVVSSLLRSKLRGWKGTIARSVSFLLGGLLFWGTLSFPPGMREALLVIAAGAAAFLARRRLNERGMFYYDAEEEREARLRIAALLLRGVAADKRNARKQPVFFRKSQPLFADRTPSTALSELMIKTVLRRGSLRMLYLQLLTVGLGGMFAAPVVWVKWVVFAFASSLLVYWLYGIMTEASRTTFVQVYIKNTGDLYDATIKALLLTALPGVLLLGVCAVVFSLV